MISQCDESINRDAFDPSEFCGLIGQAKLLTSEPKQQEPICRRPLSQPKTGAVLELDLLRMPQWTHEATCLGWAFPVPRILQVGYDSQPKLRLVRCTSTTNWQEQKAPLLLVQLA